MSGDFNDMIGADPEIIGDEIVGHDEVEGDEVEGDDDVGDEIIGDEIVGGPHHRRRRHRHHHRHGHPRKPGGRGVLHVTGFMWRREVLGISSPSVAAGATVALESQPQRKFKAKRVSVSSAIAQFFDIIDIKVGQNSQTSAPGNIPAQAFVENAVTAYIDFDTASIGNFFTLYVTNNSATAYPFGAAVFGIALRPQYA